MENAVPLESPELKTALNRYSQYLQEVRRRLLFILCVFAASTFTGFFFYEKIIKFLINALSLSGVNIVFTSPFQFISLALSSGIACGIIVSFPLLTFQILRFLKPALKEKEFKLIVKLLPISLFLFLTGLIFGFLIMKWQISMFLERSVALGIGNILDISKLLSTVLLISTFMGVGFEFPILLILIMKLGIVKREKLSKIRMWVYLGSIFFAIVLPADSIIVDIILALPLIILFELTLLLARVKQRKVEN